MRFGRPFLQASVEWGPPQSKKGLNRLEFISATSGASGKAQYESNQGKTGGPPEPAPVDRDAQGGENIPHDGLIALGDEGPNRFDVWKVDGNGYP